MSDATSLPNELPSVTTDVLELVAPANTPEIVVLAGGPGAVPGRAVARLLRDNPDAFVVVRRRDLAALGGSSDTDSAFDDLLAHARRSRRPVIIDDAGVAVSPARVLREFQTAGYLTRVVLVVARDTEAALNGVTDRLRQRAVDATARDAPERKSAVSLIRELPGAVLDRITVVDGDGAFTHDGPPGRETWAAVDAARNASLSGLQAIAWLSELRRITEYAADYPTAISEDDRAAIEALYDLADETVLPGMPIRQESEAARIQRDRLAAGRRQLLAGPRSAGGAGWQQPAQPEGPSIGT